MVFFETKIAQMYLNFLAILWIVQGIVDFLDLCLSHDLCRVFKMRDLVFGVVVGSLIGNQLL